MTLEHQQQRNDLFFSKPITPDLELEPFFLVILFVPEGLKDGFIFGFCVRFVRLAWGQAACGWLVCFANQQHNITYTPPFFRGWATPAFPRRSRTVDRIRNWELARRPGRPGRRFTPSVRLRADKGSQVPVTGLTEYNTVL